MVKEQGEPRTADHGALSAELAELRAACRRQAAVIEALTRVVGRLRTGVTALKAENAQLRAADRGFDRAEDRSSAMGTRIAVGVHAPAAARRFATRVLDDRVSRLVLERSKLVLSELVTDRLCHGSVAQGYLTVRVLVGSDEVRLEVEDSADRFPASPAWEPRLGLRIIESLSERWGRERCADGSTRAWAVLTQSPADPAANAAPAAGEVHALPIGRH